MAQILSPDDQHLERYGYDQDAAEYRRPNQHLEQPVG